MTVLKVLALGSLEVGMGERPLVALRQRKPQALLVYLLCHPRQQFSREHLELLLWSESQPAKARQSLRQTLRLLRQALPPDFLREERGQVGLNPTAAYWFDLEQLSHDITLYRGEFLLGFALKNAPVWDDWLQAQREMVAGQFVAGLDKAAHTAVASQQYPLALSHWQRALAINPWHEQTHRAIMQVYVALGDRAAALAQYEAVCNLLADDLGAEPDPQTTALAEQIRTAVADTTPRHNLPHLANPFFGRTAEQATLRAYLQNPATQLVTLVGLGGMGKTRLALEVAHQLVPVLAGGVWWVDCTAVTRPAELPTAVALALGLPPAENMAALHPALAGSPRLLLLDNFESILEAAPLLAELGQAHPHLKLLVTSRERLNLAAEQVVVLDGLTGAGEATAVQLFIERAQRVRPDFAPDETAVATIATLCRHIEGMPLAIEMAAGWVRLLDEQAIAEAIGQDVRFLQQTQQGVAERHSSVARVLWATFERLAEAEQAALTALAVFEPPFDPTAAQAVAQCSLFTLLALVDKSLLQRTEGGRFRLHEQLRQLLLAHTPPAELALLAGRHAHYYLEYVAGSPPFEQMDERRGNMIKAWYMAAEQGEETLLANALAHWGNYYDQRGFLAEAVAWMTAALALPRPARPKKATRLFVARLSRRLGAIYRRLGRWQEAEATLGQAIHHAQGLGDTLLLGRAQGELANTLADKGDVTAAIELFDAVIATFRELGDARFTAVAILSKGIALNRVGRYGEAQTTLQEALRASEAAENSYLRAICANSLGAVAIAVGDYASARMHYEQAFALLDQIGNIPHAATAYVNLATVAIHRQDWAEAAEQLAASRAYLGELPDGLTLGLQWLAEGRLWQGQGDGRQARAAYYRALDHFKVVGHERFAAEVHLLLAQVFRGEGQLGAAVLHVREGVVLAGDHWPMLWPLLGEWAAVQGAQQPAERVRYAGWLVQVAAHPATQAEARLAAEQVLAEWREGAGSGEMVGLLAMVGEVMEGNQVGSIAYHVP